MNFIAYNSQEKVSASGSFSGYNVSGTGSDMEKETNPPVIEKIFLNSESFRSGGKINSTPLFYAKVYDDTGINLSNGIGHNISLMLDGKTEYNLSSYFVTQGTSTKEGYIQYQLPELQEGNHKLQFRIWDVWNNSSVYDLDFFVDNSYKPAIYEFTLAGNPAKDKVRFIFTSDVPGSRVNVKYEVYSLNGALLWSYKEDGVYSTSNHEWDLTTSGGAKLKGGVYICRVFVSMDGENESNKSQKLIILD